MMTAIPDLALAAGVPRVVRGVRIEHVCGDPTLPSEEDAELRRRLLTLAMDALRTDVDDPQLFELVTRG
jgi:hypothetical protein